MERHANYALVGFATLALFLGLVVFIVWLARVEYGREYDLYDIVFVGPIQGLSQGGDVDFNGIKVGEGQVKIRARRRRSEAGGRPRRSRPRTCRSG